MRTLPTNPLLLLQETPPLSPLPHWFWSLQSDKEAKRLSRVSLHLQNFFHVVPSSATTKKVFLLGGLKSALREVGLEGFSKLPQSVLLLQGEKLFKLFESELAK